MPELIRNVWNQLRALIGRGRWTRLIVVVVVLVVVGMAGYRIWGSRRNAPAPYRTTVVTRGDIQQIVSATGPVDALTTLALNFKTPGRLAELYVRVGDQVTAGQVLARLETTAIEAEVAAAQAELDQVMAEYKKLLAGVRSQDHAVAQAAVDSAAVTLNTQQLDLESTQSTTEAELQVAQQEVANAGVQLEDAQRNLVQTSNINAANLAAVQQEVDNAAIQLADARQNVIRVQATNAADVEAIQQEIENAAIQVQDLQARLQLVQATNQADIEVAQRAVEVSSIELQGAQADLQQITLQNQKDLELAQAAVQKATVDLMNARSDLEAVDAGPEAVAVLNAQTSVTDAEANLAAVQQVVDANRRAAQLAVENAQAEVTSAEHVRRITYRDDDATDSQKVNTDDQLVRAQNNLKTAQMNLEQVEAEGTQQIASAQAQLNDARSSLATAQANLDQARRKAQAQVDATKAELDRQQANLGSVQAQTTGNAQTAQNKMDQTSARLQQIQAELKRAQAQAASGLQGAQQELHQASGSLASAQAKLSQTQAQSDAALQNAQENVNQANASLLNAGARLRQTEAQAGSGLQSAEQQIHDANSRLLMAQARLIQTQAQVSSSLQRAQSQVTQAQTSLQSAVADYNKVVAPADEHDLESSRARIETATARLWQAQEDLDNATLRAPVAGTVAQVNGEIGEYIGSSSTLSSSLSAPGDVPIGFILLTDLAGFKVIAQVNEVDIGRVAPGQRVTFSVDAYPGQTFEGTVATITPMGTSISDVVSYNVEIVAAPTDVVLLPNMTADVNVILAERRDVLLVPNRAITTRGGQKWVELIQGGKLTTIPINAGLSDGIYSEILEGLSEGDEIVVEHIIQEELTGLEEMEQRREKFLQLREIGGR